MTDDEISQLLSAKPSWQTDGKGLFGQPWVNPFTATGAALFQFSGAKVVRSKQEDSGGVELPGLDTPPPPNPAPSCGGGLGNTLIVVISGVTINMINPTITDPDGTYSVPFVSQSFSSGSEICIWKLDNGVFTVGVEYQAANEPIPWSVIVTDDSSGLAYFLTGSPVGLGATIPNSIVCPAPASPGCGGTATVSF